MSDSPSSTETPAATRCGFVAVIGAPNAGKSTLVNTLVGTKVSIVSPKVQTTRSRIRGVAMVGEAQVVFIDTPGIFQPRRRLERAMVAAAWGGAADADSIMLLVDAQKATGRGGVDEETRVIVDQLKASGRRDILLVLNKIDLIDRPKLLDLAATLDAEGIFARIFMISALKADGAADILAHLARGVPPGPWMFPEDEVSDLPQRLLAAELTREKVFLQLHQELPYSVLVESEQWEERADGSVRIDQTIYVARDTQKAIVLGKNGSRIKQIGADARKELETLLDRRVHLFLHVKVKENWSEQRAAYAAWGLDFDA